MNTASIDKVSNEEFTRHLMEKNPNLAAVNPALFEIAEKHPNSKGKHFAKRNKRGNKDNL